MAGEIKKFKDFNNVEHFVDRITDGIASVIAKLDRGNHIVEINGTGVDGSAVDTNEAIIDSDKLITSGAVAYSLAGKLGSSVTEKQVAVGSTTIDVDTLTAGSLYLVVNNLHAQVSNIFTCEGSSDYLHFHLNSGTLTNKYLMVRVYNWYDDGDLHHFVEVVGAWN